MKQGESQNAAIRATTEETKRSATLRDLANYRCKGFEGLIDRRTPREPELPSWVQDAIEVARMVKPSISVEQVAAIIRAKFRVTPPSGTTIKRIWKDAGLEQRAGRPGAEDGAGSEQQSKEKPVVEELEAAGFQLMQASEAETGAVKALVDTIVEAAKELPEPGPPPAEEVALRNERGQLTAAYNEARRKAPGELVAPTHRTAAEKAQARDLGRLSFRGQHRGTIEQKVWAMVSIPALPAVHGRIEDLRCPQGRFLGEFCGYVRIRVPGGDDSQAGERVECGGAGSAVAAGACQHLAPGERRALGDRLSGERGVRRQRGQTAVDKPLHQGREGLEHRSGAARADHNLR